MTDIVIASAARTAIGKFQGSLSKMPAPKLGVAAAKAALQRAGIGPDVIDEVIIGNVLQAGVGQNPARQVALGAGVPAGVGAFTVNKVCGSGLKSVMLAAQAIKAGDAEVVLAGGIENMTLAPYYLKQAREGQRLGHGELIDGMVADGLWDVYEDFHMGMTAELVAKEKGVSRDAMDEFSANSHKKAAAAQSGGKFKAEITPIEIPQRKGDPKVFDEDEGIMPTSSPEGLAKLRPAFDKSGVITAGNASQISDGAAMVVVTTAARAEALGMKPLARITGYATGGVEPKWVMMAPVEAVKNLEKKTGLKRSSFDLIEINEAFAAASCALIKELEFDAAKVNVNGGAVALGHPIGASGCRILITLLHALKDRGGKTGLATLCLGGANAVAMSVEML